ncbi:amino acid permease like integral membrane plus 11 transmembrane domain [Cryptosporidium sp. chipmunk genotype I]|uniref:amino acid permease like integral membrane plus 11 transmembrane domain n=1 Tax=Cryptosporidium sp. chipmunk genotype I TaxID=1280935 RepID=UPI00351A6F86|nr:amino acid permease like integral membrane plus 11 transmembrane domain [Cryptosporidium sp. chipmunk genotype I]
MFSHEKSSMFTTILIVVSTSVGVGCFYIPAAFKNCGAIAGVIISLIVGTFSVLSMKTLANASVKSGTESYGSLLFMAYSDEITTSLRIQRSEKPFFSVPRLFDFLVFLDCLFCIPLFLIVLSDLIPSLISYFGFVNDYLFMFSSKTAIISLFSLLFFPICIPSGCFNWIGLTFLSMISIFLCFVSVINQSIASGFGIDSIIKEISNISFNSNSIPSYFSLFNICIFAFFSQFNIIQAAANLKNPSRNRLRILTALTGIIIVFSYSIMSLISFSFLGDKTEEFLLNSLSDTSYLFFISRLLVVISLFFIIPLHIYPMLDALTNFIDNNYLSEMEGSRNVQTGFNEQGIPLINNGNHIIASGIVNNKTTFIRTKTGRILLLTLILFLSCIIGIKFQNRPSSLVIMVGGFVDSIFVFLFPALIHHRVIYNKKEKFTSSPIRLLLSFLFIISVLGSVNLLLSLYFH